MVQKASILVVFLCFLISIHSYGQAVLPRPGAQINEDKVDEILKEGNLSLSKIADVKATAAELENDIKKMKQLLQKGEVQNDKELQFSLHTILGSTYLRLFEHTGQTKDLGRAIHHAGNAISIFKNNSSYKADLADAYMVRSSARVLKKEYDQAISTMKYLIEEYQGIGFGPYRNWFASQQVEGLYKLASMDSLKSEKRKQIVNYLDKTADKYDNEVGISAQIALLRHYAEMDDQTKARALNKLVKDRLAALDNPSFKKDKWGQAQTYLKRMENRIARAHGQTERDTLFYELKSRMIKQAEVEKMEVKSPQYYINILLKEKYHEKFGRLTGENIGNYLAVVHNGEVLSPSLPTIQAYISGGRFSIGSFKNEEKAKRTMQRISNGK